MTAPALPTSRLKFRELLGLCPSTKLDRDPESSVGPESSARAPGAWAWDPLRCALWRKWPLPAEMGIRGPEGEQGGGQEAQFDQFWFLGTYWQKADIPQISVNI